MFKKVLLVLGVLVLLVIIPWLVVRFVRYQGLKNNITSNLTIGNRKEWQNLLDQVGWGKTGDCQLLSGESIQCEKLKKLEIIYTDMKQDFLQQTVDGSGSAFAAVGEKVLDDKLTLSVYVAPEKLADGSDKGWWIAHQVIWALDMIFEPEVEIYQNMFAKYQNSNLLIFK